MTLLRQVHVWLQVAKLRSKFPSTRHTVLGRRHIASSSFSDDSKDATLANAAEASGVFSQRLAEEGPPLVGPSFPSHQADKHADALSEILRQHTSSNAHVNLSGTLARRSAAARFGTSRHTTFPALNVARDPVVDSEAQDDDYKSSRGTSISSISLPEYVQWAIDQLIAASEDPKLLRTDYLKVAKLTDPQDYLAEVAKMPPKRSTLLHLATVSPKRYAAILAVLAEVRQRLSTSAFPSSEDQPKSLKLWIPDTVLDYDCGAGEGLWAASKVFQDDNIETTSAISQYSGFDRRPNLLKTGKKIAECSSSSASPANGKSVAAVPVVRTKEGGEVLEMDGMTFFEEETEAHDKNELEQEQEQNQEQEQEAKESDAEPILQYFQGQRSEMSSVQKTFQSVPLATDQPGMKGSQTLALSAFALSLMTTDANRFEAVQAMWDSGAEVIVVIDEATPRGFASVASARAQLLHIAKGADVDAHVVAPCSHDKPCPLLHPFFLKTSNALAVNASPYTGNPNRSKEVCGFFARYRVPEPLWKTKHAKGGEEISGYSYVVIKRGRRPSLAAEAEQQVAEGNGDVDLDTVLAGLKSNVAQSKTGILDLLRSAKQASKKLRELEELEEISAENDSPDSVKSEALPQVANDSEGKMLDKLELQEMLKSLPDALQAKMADKSGGTNIQKLSADQINALVTSVRERIAYAETHDDGPSVAHEAKPISVPLPSPATEAAMRLESYSWPRLIKPPFKKGGHVTFDACCSNGNIERFSISKSVGRQAYQDARKAKLGDIFPHPPRTKVIVRALNPLTALEKQYPDCPADELESKLELRAPNKLFVKSGGGKDKKKKQVMGQWDEEAENVLEELYAERPDGAPYKPLLQRRGRSRPDVNFRLISPNFVWPTKKQVKQMKMNYASKWDQLEARSKKGRAQLASAGTDSDTAPAEFVSESDWPNGYNRDSGFRSVLQASSPENVRRASRKKSRGDWDAEFFKH